MNITRSEYLNLILGAFIILNINMLSCSADMEKLSSDVGMEKSSLKREDEVTLRVPGIGRARISGHYGRRVLRSGRPIFVAPPTFGKMKLHRPIVLNNRYRQAYG